MSAHLCGHCPVCGLTIPAFRPLPPYEHKARLIPHNHRNPRFGLCIGSRFLASPMAGDVQIHLFAEPEERAA